MKKFQVYIVALVILIYIGSTVFLQGLTGYSGDIIQMQGWGNDAFEKGITTIYSNENVGKYNYPPLYYYVLQFNSFLNFKLFGDMIVRSSFTNKLKKPYRIRRIFE